MTYIKSNWRPLLALTYGFICICDFTIFPVVWQSIWHLTWIAQTTKDGGMLHLSFGAILGAAAYTRGQEKVAAIQAGVAEVAQETETR